MKTTKPGICRLCPAFCQIVAEVDDGVLTKVKGDAENAFFNGYTCPKGRFLPEQHNGPYRLLHSQKRTPAGNFESIASESAMDEVSQQIQAILDEHGPRSIAVYGGTGQLASGVTPSIAVSFLAAIGSPMHFTSSTIDQPGKAIAMAAHGLWSGGELDFHSADSWIVVGANPVISKSSGAPGNNPGQKLKEAQERGLKLIVIDPRRTETAKRAHIHLQARPGEDPTVLAGLLHVIISEGLFDSEFVESDVDGFHELRDALSGFTPNYVANRAGLDAKDLIDAARAYSNAVGQKGRGGAVTLCTGPNMSLHGSLSEYLGYCLMSVCGYWAREGDRVVKPNVMTPAYTAKAQAMPPYQGWDYPEKMRVRNLAKTASGMPTAALADEILLEGEGQVKALICLAGNPMMAWPDQEKTHAALQSLDLLICLDYRMTATAELADYVIAPKLSLETPATTFLAENNKHYGYGLGFCEPYASYAPPVVEPPRESDVIEDWEFFYGLGQRMGLSLFIASQAGWDQFNESPPAFAMLDMTNKPSTDELHSYLSADSRIPLEEVKTYPNGHIFDIHEIVQPKDEGFTGKLCVGDPMMIKELASVFSEISENDSRFPFRLISRRMNNVVNSSGRESAKLAKAFNPAFMHPDDLAALGILKGDTVQLSSSHGTILGVAESDSSLRRGIVSMTHCYGGAPDKEKDKDKELFKQLGSNTGRLVSVEKDYDPLTGIPRMSNIPVGVTHVKHTAYSG